MAAQLVKVHYKGTLDDGSIFDSSEGGEPIQFVEGAHHVIKGFEDAVRDMQPGDTKKVHLEPRDAYGERDERLVQVIPTDSIPNADQLPVGKTVYFKNPAGYPMPALVEKVEDGNVHLDFNHQLAGKALNFELTLVSREDAPEDNCTHNCSTCGGCH